MTGTGQIEGESGGCEPIRVAKNAIAGLAGLCLAVLIFDVARPQRVPQAFGQTAVETAITSGTPNAGAAESGVAPEANVTAGADGATGANGATGATADKVAAEANVPPETVAAIARGLNCPLCQGYNLQDCPLELCAQMRELIRQKLAAGESRQAIVDAFVHDYGPQVLNAPPKQGFFLTAWLLPVVALMAGLLWLGRMWRPGWRPGIAHSDGAGGGGSAADAEYIRRFEALAEEGDES